MFSIGPKSWPRNQPKPRGPKGVRYGDSPILPRQQGPQLNLDLRQVSSESGAAAGQIAQLLVGFRRDVGQGNLVDSQEIGQQLGVELVGLRAALYHGPQAHADGPRGPCREAEAGRRASDRFPWPRSPRETIPTSSRVLTIVAVSEQGMVTGFMASPTSLTAASTTVAR